MTQSYERPLVQRFDVKHNKPCCHFLSAHSAFNVTNIHNTALKSQYSYGFLAEFIMKYGAEPLDAHDLFYRMVFNVLIGNTDDHALNHAFVYNFSSQQWRLSKAYDVLPINNSRQHGIGIGDFGRDGTLENLLSQCSRFGLKQFKAEKIIDEVKSLSHEWPYYFAQYGVSSADIERLKGVIPSSLMLS